MQQSQPPPAAGDTRLDPGAPAMFADLFDSIDMGIAIYRVIDGGDDVVFVDMNAAGCRLTGVSRKTIRGRSVRNVFPGVVSMGLYEVLLEVWRTGHARNHPITRYQDKLLETWFENRVFRLPSEEVVAVFEDATERQRAAETLETSRRRLLVAQRVGRLGFLDWDLTTNTVTWSDEMCRWYEKPVHERVQTLASTMAVVHPEDRSTVERAWRTAARGGPPYDLVHRMVRPGGDTVWVQAQSEIESGVDGAPRRLLGTVVDITALHEANASLQRLNEELEIRVAERTERLERVNRELEQFAHAVAHDLKAPLRTIQGFSAIILESHRGELSPHAADHFEHVRAAACEMQATVDDLLEYCNLGRVPGKLTRVHLVRFVERAWQRIGDRVRRESAHLAIHGDLPDVQADPRLLERILVNLFENAVTFHAPGIHPRIDVTAWQTGSAVCLEIRDNGIGIERRFHDSVFDVFQRLHPKNVYPGSGIGLAVVKKSVELMHATIALESESGYGTSVRVIMQAPASVRAGAYPEVPTMGAGRPRLRRKDGKQVVLHEMGDTPGLPLGGGLSAPGATEENRHGSTG